MNTNAEKLFQKKGIEAAAGTGSNNLAMQLEDNRPQSVVQQKQMDALSNAKPLQRQANNTGLPDNLKSGIENLSGHSLDDVSVHYNSDKPAQLNAHSYAQGTDIHIASGQEKHLPHEAWHVVQQKQGRVKPTMQMKGKVNLNDDEGLEKEADVMGAKAVQGKHKIASPFSNPVVSRKTIQRRLIVNGTNYTDLLAGGANGDLATIVDQVYGQMIVDAEVAGDVALHGGVIGNMPAIKRQLEKWIENLPGDNTGTHPEFGRKQQNRSYPDFYELAKGLLGWVEGKPGRRFEKNLADTVYTNEPLKTALNGLLVKLFYKIQNLEKEGLVDNATQANILQELTTGLSIVTNVQFGHYQKYHRQKAIAKGNVNIDHGIGADQLDVLRDPLKYTIKDKVIILHDLMEYFGTHQAWNPLSSGQALLPVETRNDTMVSTAVDVTGERSAEVSMSDGTPADKKRARGMGITSSTRDERAPNTLLARQHGLAVWAGQSMTTVRMMKLAQWAGADAFENAALAMSIFAYWRKDYDHTAEYAYHTLFEVMDVAKNFGVPYLIQDGASHRTPVIDLQSMLNKLTNDYQALVLKTRNLITQVQGLAVPPLILAQLRGLMQNIAQEDAAVRAAYTIARNALQPGANRQQSLNEITIRLEIAADNQRQIERIIATIPAPAPAPVFDPDIFFA